MLGVPPASEYLRHFQYDLAMHDPKLTRMLIDLVGADRVVCRGNVVICAVIRLRTFVTVIMVNRDGEHTMDRSRRNKVVL